VILNIELRNGNKTQWLKLFMRLFSSSLWCQSVQYSCITHSPWHFYLLSDQCNLSYWCWLSLNSE